MVSGVKTLHQIDRSIQQARYDVGKASELPARISKALIELRGKQAHALGKIARLRLDLIADGGEVRSRKGDDLGYVDRQAGKLLAAHAEQEASLRKETDESAARISALEAERRRLEKDVTKAIKDYDAAALACQKALVKDPNYIALVTAAEQAESILERAEQKRDLAIEDEREKGEPYRTDSFFAYLQKRRFGQKDAKGWFLTRALDRWVAGKIDYQTAAVNYRRLQDIPRRLQSHVEALELKAIAARDALKKAEEDMLIERGVEDLRKASIMAQTHLEKCDAKIDAAEAQHQELQMRLAEVTAGQSGPYREALSLLTETLERRDLPSLKVLAAQTPSSMDDTAVRDLARLRETGRDLEDDQFEASKLLDKYRKGLAELEAVRRQFKSRRYDAPYSQFPSGGDMIGALIGQVLAGMLSGNDLWRQIERAQKTISRGADIDFGGIDWEEAIRLPRKTRRRSRSRNGGIDLGDIFGGGSSRGGWGGSRSTRTRPRTRRSRAPKVSFPKGGRRGGGFKTGGGF